MGVLDIALNNWWWGSSLEALRDVEYSFIAIATKSVLTQSGGT